ncbi:hypothetical protein ACFWPK_33455 [Nocardia sp. NPDC058519]|uniref:hypothetical protein n=1 Tax=Nocardia sp. NPDC058519 TaxID=3346535 RepID=UPI0036508144
MVTSQDRPRQGHRWDGNDYQMLIAGLIAGMPERELARGLGRSPSAMRDRAEYLVELADPKQRKCAWEMLRAALALDPHHDWESIARRRHIEQELPYWDDAADELLARAWAETAPRSRWKPGRRAGAGSRMRELENTLDIHEHEIADRLRCKGLASSRLEVVQRLGAAADGYLAAQARLITDRDGATVHVLVVTDDSGAVLHTSLHPSRSRALEHKDKIATGFATQPMAVWTVQCRTVGYGEISSDTTTLTGNFASETGRGATEQDITVRPGSDQWSAPFETPLEAARELIDLDTVGPVSGSSHAHLLPLPKKLPRQSRPIPPTPPGRN